MAFMASAAYSLGVSELHWQVALRLVVLLLRGLIREVRVGLREWLVASDRRDTVICLIGRHWVRHHQDWNGHMITDLWLHCLTLIWLAQLEKLLHQLLIGRQVSGLVHELHLPALFASSGSVLQGRSSLLRERRRLAVWAIALRSEGRCQRWTFASTFSCCMHGALGHACAVGAHRGRLAPQALCK